MVSSTVRLETRWRLHLDSVGGEHYFFFPLVYVSSSNVIAVRSGRTSPRQHLVHSTITLAVVSILSNFDLFKKADENARVNIDLQVYGKFQFQFWLSWLLSVIYFYSQPLNFPSVIKPRFRYTAGLVE